MVGAVKGKIYCMKKLMLGNEAFARGLYEAGCKVVSSYPGTPSTEITEAVAKALAAYPQVNVSVDGYNILFKKHINIGIAVSLNDGNLIVPVVHDADHLNLNGWL